MSLLAMQENQYEIAVKHLDNAVAKTPDSPVTHYYLAQAYRALPNPSRSIEQLEIAVRLSPQSSWWSLLAKWYEESDMDVKAANARAKATSSKNTIVTPVPNDRD